MYCTHLLTRAQSSIDNTHDSEHLFFLPRLTDDLHVHRKPRHRPRIVRTLGPLKDVLQQLRPVAWCGTPRV